MFRIVGRALRWAAGRIPTVLAWAGLAGLFVYGSTHGWKFGEEPEKAAEKKAAEEPDREPFTAYYRPQPGDVPVLVTHDPARCNLGERTIRLKSPDAAAKAGIRTERAAFDWVTVTVTAHGEVMADATAVAKVSPRAGGVLAALEKRLGDPVRPGELLALVESADVGRAKAAYLTAKVQHDSRERKLAALKSNPDANPASVAEADALAREARAGLFSARQAVANFGLPLPSAEEEKLPDEAFTRRLQLIGVPFFHRLEVLARAARTGVPPTANLLPIFSPLGGVVTARTGVVGETVAALQPVFEVGDPTRVFVGLDVRQEDMAAVAVGQEVTFRLEGGVDLPAAEGAVDWISPTVDEKTRTVRVRARVPNPGGVLRAGSFGGGAITVEPPAPALVVPREAVHWEGCCFVVFVRKSETEYQPRKVTLGVREGPAVEVAAGLEPGDEVVTAGSHVLKNELLKAQIGQAED